MILTDDETEKLISLGFIAISKLCRRGNIMWNSVLQVYETDFIKYYSSKISPFQFCAHSKQ
jgi:hypothetical protein